MFRMIAPRGLWLIFSVVLLVGVSAIVLTSTVLAAPGSQDKDVAKDLAKVRNATAKYHDPAAAAADGYVPTDECVEIPGVAAMGLHYVNPGLIFDNSGNPDAVLDTITPEVLLYIPTPAGPRLTGVEYFRAFGPPGSQLSDGEAGGVVDPGTPFLFGRPMNGPMDSEAGGNHGPAPHYDLHVWVWQANPDGIFEDFNPNLACPQE